MIPDNPIPSPYFHKRVPVNYMLQIKSIDVVEVAQALKMRKEKGNGATPNGEYFFGRFIIERSYSFI